MEEETQVEGAVAAGTEAAAHGTETLPYMAEEMGMCVDADGSAIGMPQICPDWFPNQMFWLVVALVVIFLILSRIALPRIGAVLAERAGSISNDLAAAEEFRAKAAAAEKAYDKALTDARAEANRIIAATKAEIQAELATELQRAEAQISAKAAEGERAIADIRDQAVVSVTAVAKDTAREIVAAFGGTVEGDTIDAAVDARVKG
jgi:F-type H+-transporting ATPase subunit b